MPKDLLEEAKRLRAEFVAEFIGRLDRAGDSTESPIEMALFWALVRSGGNSISACKLPRQWGFGVEDYELPNGGDFGWIVDVRRHAYETSIMPQKYVHCGGTNYRVDLALELRADHLGRQVISIAVECDGHDFHEKTKEQAARDKARDRALQSLGWYVARFTGSEIYRSPEKIAGQVWEFADSVHSRVLDRLIEAHRESEARALEARPPDA